MDSVNSKGFNEIDCYLDDLIVAIRNVEGGKEYVKNFNDKDGFVNNTSNR